MTFLEDSQELRARLVHHTGSMVRFTTSQLVALASQDCDVAARFPDGVCAVGRFHPHPQNPYIAGAPVVQWIKGWVPYARPVEVAVRQVGDELCIVVPSTFTPPEGSVSESSISAVTRKLSALAHQPVGPRRRVRYEAWERNPHLRAVVLAAWGARCQVVGCDLLEAVRDGDVTNKLVDVHHVTHVGLGGQDSPANLTVLCVVHHAILHRVTPTTVVTDNLTQVIIRVGLKEILVERDVAALMAVLGE